jgi:hypothetical protein
LLTFDRDRRRPPILVDSRFFLPVELIVSVIRAFSLVFPKRGFRPRSVELSYFREMERPVD